MSETTDRNDPRLTRGVDETPVPQSDAYLVLSREERAKGFVRPLRTSYRHVGPSGPKFPADLRDLTPDQKERYGDIGYVKYEPYPDSESPALGRFWTQAQLDAVGKGCNTVTTMSLGLAETYARDPHFYGATYCVECQMHRPIDEFTWIDPHGHDTNERLGS
jgi:hypothetical protein